MNTWSMMTLALVVSLTQVGCGDRDATTSGNFGKQASVARLTRLESELSTLNQERFRVESERARHEAQVDAYLLHHKMATAAIVGGAGGTALALSDDNRFSEEAKQIGGFVGAIGGLYILFNMEEVAEVFDVVNNTSMIQGKYQQRLRYLDHQISQRHAQLSSTETRFASM